MVWSPGFSRPDVRIVDPDRPGTLVPAEAGTPYPESHWFGDGDSFKMRSALFNIKKLRGVEQGPTNILQPCCGDDRRGPAHFLRRGHPPEGAAVGSSDSARDI